ncbi:hypothetical protein ACOMHN_013899 [Nucella lapillus]
MSCKEKEGSDVQCPAAWLEVEKEPCDCRPGWKWRWNPVTAGLEMEPCDCRPGDETLRLQAWRWNPVTAGLEMEPCDFRPGDGTL